MCCGHVLPCLLYSVVAPDGQWWEEEKHQKSWKRVSKHNSAKSGRIRRGGSERPTNMQFMLVMTRHQLFFFASLSYLPKYFMHIPPWASIRFVSFLICCCLYSTGPQNSAKWKSYLRTCYNAMQWHALWCKCCIRSMISKDYTILLTRKSETIEDWINVREPVQLHC